MNMRIIQYSQFNTVLIDTRVPPAGIYRGKMTGSVATWYSREGTWETSFPDFAVKGIAVPCQIEVTAEGTIAVEFSK